MEQTVEISLDRLQDLEMASLKLDALVAAGVDNWSGYQYAMEIYQELLDEVGMEED